MVAKGGGMVLKSDSRTIQGKFMEIYKSRLGVFFETSHFQGGGWYSNKVLDGFLVWGPAFANSVPGALLFSPCI